MRTHFAESRRSKAPERDPRHYQIHRMKQTRTASTIRHSQTKSWEKETMQKMPVHHLAFVRVPEPHRAHWSMRY